MSIPLENLYHYIEQISEHYYNGRVIIYRFYPDGEKKIDNLHQLSPMSDPYLWSISPEIFCNDQEPVNYDYYEGSKINSDDISLFFFKHNVIKPEFNFRGSVDTIWDKVLLLHSEVNSQDVIKYQSRNFIPVYYWSHAIIARDWFRYAKHVNLFKKSLDTKFLIYNRAWSGTREYRLKFTDCLIENNLINDCKTTCNPFDNDVHYTDHNFANKQWIPTHKLENFFPKTSVSSNYSASFEVNDYQNSFIEVVLETLFDDSRIHLTEKSLRPIALGQPFILVSTPGSLQYLRNYGFKTFSSVFDESYDTILDSNDRMQAIIHLMKEIKNWDSTKLDSAYNELSQISQYNRSYFFSNEFFTLVTDELKTNLYKGIDIIKHNNTSYEWLKKYNYLISNNDAYDYITQLAPWEFWEALYKEVTKTSK